MVKNRFHIATFRGHFHFFVTTFPLTLLEHSEHVNNSTEYCVGLEPSNFDFSNFFFSRLLVLWNIVFVISVNKYIFRAPTISIFSVYSRIFSDERSRSIFKKISNRYTRNFQSDFSDQKYLKRKPEAYYINLV